MVTCEGRFVSLFLLLQAIFWLWNPESSEADYLVPLRFTQASGGLSATKADETMIVFRTIALLAASNVFMTFAWYAHLKNLNDRPWLVAALASWGIALFEYLLQVPANRIGYSQLSLGQLKILQEAITLTVFVPFAVFYMKEPLRLDYLWAGLCILGAVFFIFRAKLGAAG